MFNAFLSSLPDVLDRNVKVGNLLAPNLLAVLIYCPSPQKAPGERYPPNYSLWLVDPPLRHSWLVSSLIFLYKVVNTFDFRFSFPAFEYNLVAYLNKIESSN
jgi:hypothetical protein